MALVHADFVEETSTTTGTGTLDLGGVTTGSRSFASAIGNSNTCYYGILASDGDQEVGVGTVTTGSPDTLARTTLIASTTGSKLDLPAGTHKVYVTYSSAQVIDEPPSDDAYYAYRNGAWIDITNYLTI